MADHTKTSSKLTDDSSKKTAERLFPGQPITESLRIAVIGPEEVLETKSLANDLQELLKSLGHKIKMMVADKSAWEPDSREGSSSNIAQDADLVLSLIHI